ncbi:MAG: heme exporter protein CcmB [Deltaproteobacteria bacterium]|nr:heme exporter protein CcmB [Deltaproteobacteria bacterium]MBW2395178.1 heme exporter protein CcmB [Deltaproteobacteria bacterium]
MSILWTLLWKDLLTEWRSRDRLVAMLVFALLVVVVLYFAAPPGQAGTAREHVPGLLWVAYIFAIVLGLSRSFGMELENEALSGLALAPVDRGLIFLGKAGANLVLVLIMQAVAAVAFALAFDVNLGPVALPLAGVAFLGAVGLCSLGTLFSAMAVRTTNREMILPLLMLPLMVPVLLGAVQATRGLIAEGELPFSALQLLLVTDGVFLIVSFLGFEYVLDE